MSKSVSHPNQPLTNISTLGFSLQHSGWYCSVGLIWEVLHIFPCIILYIFAQNLCWVWMNNYCCDVYASIRFKRSLLDFNYEEEVKVSSRIVIVLRFYKLLSYVLLLEKIPKSVWMQILFNFVWSKYIIPYIGIEQLYCGLLLQVKFYF